MYCEFCGNKIEDDSLFCESCGKSVNTTSDRVRKVQSQGKGRYRKKKKSTGLKIGKLLIAIALIVIAVFACSFIFSEHSDSHGDDYILLVQNGYLGEFTDLTVKEILDGYYGMLYEESEWDGGVTDSGTIIVQAKYYGEGLQEGPTTIQFTMLDEECFKITAFVDPANPIDKQTDLYAAMNYNYLLVYLAENRSVAGDPLAEKDLITRLEQISGSAVQYGASANYSGDRATICEIDGQAPLDVSVVMLLDNYGLLDMSYYWGTDVSDVTSPTEPDETQTTVPSTEPSEVEYNADEILLAVLKGESSFIMSDTSEEVFIDSIKRIGYDEFDDPLIPILCAYVDMDQDGQQEIIIELTNNADGWRVILRYQDGTVYGYGYHYRGLQSISTDGLVMASSGAAYSDVFRMRFDYGEAKEEYLSSVDSEYALENWIEVEWHDYGNFSFGIASPEKPSGNYPLDLIGHTTEDVVNAFGETFIYEDGFAGSKLFYYGTEPDVHYGFIPHDWSNPVLTGSESISIIIVTGDVQLCANLSAGMNKAEIDAVAWEISDVQNVSNGSSHDMMSGNIYQYEIETTSAIITFTWYLDNGDNIEYAASEIVIVSK